MYLTDYILLRACSYRTGKKVMGGYNFLPSKIRLLNFTSWESVTIPTTELKFTTRSHRACNRRTVGRRWRRCRLRGLLGIWCVLTPSPSPQLCPTVTFALFRTLSSKHPKLRCFPHMPCSLRLLPPLRMPFYHPHHPLSPSEIRLIFQGPAQVPSMSSPPSQCGLSASSSPYTTVSEY